LVVGTAINSPEDLAGLGVVPSTLTQSVREQPVKEITAHLVRQNHFQMKPRMQEAVVVARGQLVQLQLQEHLLTVVQVE
jgi:hypothetical protein